MTSIPITLLWKCPPHGVKIKVVVGIAEAVDRAMIEKIKTLQCFKKSADGGQGEICHG